MWPLAPRLRDERIRVRLARSQALRQTDAEPTAPAGRRVKDEAQPHRVAARSVLYATTGWRDAGGRGWSGGGAGIIRNLPTSPSSSPCSSRRSIPEKVRGSTVAPPARRALSGLDGRDEHGQDGTVGGLIAHLAALLHRCRTSPLRPSPNPTLKDRATPRPPQGRAAARRPTGRP